MKELSIEQKARAYDEALEKAKNLHKDAIDMGENIRAKQCEIIFPVLKESEDEKIRKEMIFYFQEEIPLCSIQEHADKMKEFVAWLEKQKPVEFCEEDEKIRKAISIYLDWLDGRKDYAPRGEYSIRDMLVWLNKQSEQNPKHFELKAGHWYICHRAFCCRADHLTVKEGERFMCEKDGIVRGFVIKEPEKYFKEVCAPAPMEDEQKPAEWEPQTGDTFRKKGTTSIDKAWDWIEDNVLSINQQDESRLYFEQFKKYMKGE